MNDNTLKSLKCITKQKVFITLSPSFSKSVKNYSCLVPSDTESLFFQIVTNEPDAFFQLQKANADGSLSIPEGPSEAQIKVDAPDGSSCLYKIEIYRPSDNDASLKGFEFSQGVLVPDFLKAEAKYTLIVDSFLNELDLKGVPLNSKAKVDISGVNEQGKIPLLMGQTSIEIKVTSFNGKNTFIYTVDVCKIKAGTRPSLPTTQELTCSLCFCLIYRPLRCACGESLCFNCIQLLDNQMNQQKSDLNCPFCDKNNTITFDSSLQQKVNDFIAACPYEVYGCDSRLSFRDLALHVKSCVKTPTTCTECGRIASELGNGKHKDVCFESCSCGRKISKEDSSYHSVICPSKRTLPSSVDPIVRSWEATLVDKKTWTTLDSCLNSVNELLDKYMSTLLEATKVCKDTMGSNPITPSHDILLQLTKLYATAIAWNTETRKLKGGSFNFTLHLKLGLALEEAYLAQQAFPIVLVKKEAEANDNKAANDSAMCDEFNGLLLQLGIPPNTNDATKLQAVEQEYHRLLNQGLSDQAAEVQGIYQWKVQSISKASKNTSDSSSGSLSSSLVQVLEKYQDAVSISPTDSEACFHLGRLLLQNGNPKDALSYLQVSVGNKPLWTQAKFFLGSCLISMGPSATPDFEYGVNLVLNCIQEYKHQVWNQMHSPTKQGQLVDSFYKLSHPGFQNSINILFKGLLNAGKYDQAVSIYLDLLYLLPDEIKKTNKRSADALGLLQWIFLCHKEILLIQSRIKDGNQRFGKINRLLVKVFSLSEKDSLFQERIAQALVYTDQKHPLYLCLLGQSQLNQFDSNSQYANQVGKLEESKTSFTTSISAETEILTDSCIQSQEWFKTMKQFYDTLDKLDKEKVLAKEPSKAIKGKSEATKKTTTAPPKAIPNTKATPNTNAKASTAPSTAKPNPASKPSKPTKTTKAEPPKGKAVGGIEVSGPTPVAVEQGLDSKLANSTKPITKLWESRLGLARTLTRLINFSDPATYVPDIIKWYKQVISIKPNLHDAYIELGQILEKYQDNSSAADLYSSFPFTQSTESNQDDLYLHGEITRLLIKEKKYKEPQLLKSLIAEGKGMGGIRSLSKYVDILDGANESKLLMQLYAGVNGKPETDPELVAFFKSRFWL